MEWRPRWERSWAERRHCSRRCAARRPRGIDQQLEQVILALLSDRPRGSSICPSEAARQLRPADWRQWMEATRSAARRLAARGAVEVTQAGRRIDAAAMRGPVRLRLPAVTPPLPTEA